jgi:hypothetical protein
MNGKRLTIKEFVEKARKVHCDKYDYSKVVYVDYYTHVCITCPIHGDFKQTPVVHFRGNGCRKCGESKSNGLVFGVGLNDVNIQVFKDGKIIPSYSHWREMIKRCVRKPYDNSSCCDEWLRYSNFLKWFNSPSSGYQNGYALDKNILVKGNKIYSPDTCCFVPQEINNLIQNNSNRRGSLPIGVRKKGNKFEVFLSINRNMTYIGTFNTIEEAFAAYKQAKEKHVKEVAQKYFDEGKITKRVYDALMRYEVEITD